MDIGFILNNKQVKKDLVEDEYILRVMYKHYPEIFKNINILNLVVYYNCPRHINQMLVNYIFCEHKKQFSNHFIEVVQEIRENGVLGLLHIGWVKRENYENMEMFVWDLY